MTSNPASIRALAMTLAPRSWPSRPGFAIRTRTFCVGARAAVPLFLAGLVPLIFFSVTFFCGISIHSRISIYPENPTQHIANLLNGAVRSRALQDVRHHVFFSLRRPLEARKG